MRATLSARGQPHHLTALRSAYCYSSKRTIRGVATTQCRPSVVHYNTVRTLRHNFRQHGPAGQAELVQMALLSPNSSDRPCAVQSED